MKLVILPCRNVLYHVPISFRLRSLLHFEKIIYFHERVESKSHSLLCITTLSDKFNCTISIESTCYNLLSELNNPWYFWSYSAVTICRFGVLPALIKFIFTLFSLLNHCFGLYSFFIEPAIQITVSECSSYSLVTSIRRAFSTLSTKVTSGSISFEDAAGIK